MMEYLQGFYPLDIDDSYTKYIISELKYDHNFFFFAGCGFKQRNFECLRCFVTFDKFARVRSKY